MRKRFLSVVMAGVLLAGSGVVPVHAANPDRQYLNPDPDATTASGIVPSSFTVATNKPEDFSGLVISIPDSLPLTLTEDGTKYTVTDYAEVKGELADTKKVTGDVYISGGHYFGQTPDGNDARVCPKLNNNTGWEWTSDQLASSEATDTQREFTINADADSQVMDSDYNETKYTLQECAGEWNGYAQFTFTIVDA